MADKTRLAQVLGHLPSSGAGSRCSQGRVSITAGPKSRQRRVVAAADQSTIKPKSPEIWSIVWRHFIGRPTVKRREITVLWNGPYPVEGLEQMVVGGEVPIKGEAAHLGGSPYPNDRTEPGRAGVDPVGT